MEPAEQSGTTGQTSPRGNDWEVVQLTASNYGSTPRQARSEPSEEESEGQVYGTKGGDSALLMSGHFSVPRNEAQHLGTGSSKERQEARGSEYARSDEGGDDDPQEKLKDGDDDHDTISSLDKGKSLSALDVESDDGNALRGASLAAEDPVRFSSSGYSAPEDAEKESSWSPAESKTEMKAEEPILAKLDPVTGSSEVVASAEESRPDGSGVPRDAWWRKQVISLYRSARESNKFWPIFVATALMGMAYFRRRWLRGKLQLQQVKLQPASSKEGSHWASMKAVWNRDDQAALRWPLCKSLEPLDRGVRKVERTRGELLRIAWSPNSSCPR